jgi:pimeloyl-ACP methyl ester carboxylesterase
MPGSPPALPPPPSLALADGRRLAWAEYGDPNGRPVVFCHGSPGSRLPFVPRQDEIASERGVRLLAVERPGFGASTRHRARTLTGWADDVRALADHLALERFAVVGFSGGGPHALACAARLGDRLTRAIAVGCGAPWWEVPALAAQMDRRRRLLRFFAMRAPWLLRLILATLPNPRRRPEALMRAMLAGLPKPDQEILDRPEVFALAAPYNAAGVLDGFAGLCDELRVLGRPWGFALAEIAVPVLLWHGSVDAAAPLPMAEYLAATIPGAELRVVAGAGHLIAIDRWGEILASAIA